MSTVKQPKTLLEVIRYFADEQVAFEAMRDRRWPSGDVVCPLCNCERVRFMASVRRWQCNGCRKQFSVKAGTIFEDSPISFTKWIPAMWLIANCKNGISSYELHRALGVTQKTAWFMLHRIRLAMQDGSVPLLGGSEGSEIEIDETFVGGKSINMHKRKEMDAVKRFATWFRIEAAAIQPSIKRHAKPGSTIFTDYHGSYHGLYKMFSHGIVDHQTAYVFGPYLRTHARTSGAC